MRILLPMSGIGKRFKEAGYTDPKPLIRVDGKTMIEHVIDLFPGETEFDCICNDEHLETTEMRKILLRKVPTARIHEVSVKNRKGPVDAVLQIAQHIPDDEECIVSYCDYGTQWDYKGFLEEMRSTNADGGIAAYIGFHPHMLGSDNYAFMKHTDKWVTDIQEKQPFTENKMNEYASNGTYYFRTGAILKKYFQKLIDLKMELKGEYYVSLVYKLMCQDGLRTRIFEIQKMLQWGTPKDLEEYMMWSSYFEKRRTQPLQHPAVAEDTTTILPMAGAGSRFQMVGYTTPKPLLPVHDTPMFIEALNCLPPSGRTVIISQYVHTEKYPIQDIIGENLPNGELYGVCKVTDGQACTVEIGLDMANVPDTDPILVTACDNGVYYDTKKVKQLIDDPTTDVVVWAFTNHPTGKLYPHMYAWLDVDGQGLIRDVSIKKAFTDRPNTHAIIGTMWFKNASLFREGLKEVYEKNMRTNNEFYVDNLLQPLIDKGYRVRVFEVDYYLCWGTPNDYKTYQYWDEYFSYI